MRVPVAITLLLFLLWPSASHAERRVALLIGNQGYNARVGPLKNPHHDVALIAAALGKLGFKTSVVKDADYRSIDAAIKRHIATVRREGQGTISFVYYSGHGAADPDTKINYLIPVDVANADDEELWNYSLNLNTVVEGLRAQAPGATHYVVFDACRNELNLTRKGRKALVDKGFVPIAYTPGVMVAYATAPGRTASDIGSGGGPYAKALADEIVRPGVDSMLVFTRVARRVQREIGQDPFLSASTMPEVYFAGDATAAPGPVATPMQPQLSEAAREWSRVDKTSVVELETFLRRHGSSAEADYARARLEANKKQQVAVAAPPPAVKPAPVAPSRVEPAVSTVPSRPEPKWSGPRWEPIKPVQFVIPAGTGGGADQMARYIQGVVAKHNLMQQPIVTLNKPGGAGAEGFLEVKKAAGDPHNIIIALSNLFATPLATGVPVGWKDLTPVAMLALDQFVLWVPADAPYMVAKDYIDAVKAGSDRSFKMGGTGSRQEDQIITVALEKLTAPKKFTYLPYAGGGTVALGLVGKHVNSSVNNPIEAVSQWKAGTLKPLCIFDSKRSVYTAKVTATMAWSDIPTCKEAGVDTTYQMLRGIFMPPGVKREHVAFWVDLLEKVMATAEWKTFMEQGAFNQTFMTGDEFKKWVEANDKLHYDLMKEAGFLAPGR